MDLESISNPNFKSQLTQDSYPSYLAAAGNIYSCRYGIYHKSSDEFTPPKEDIFFALLAEYQPALIGKIVTLKRFDVYYNQRLLMLSIAGGAIGGAVGNAITRSANKDNYGFTDENLYLYKVPEMYPVNTNENAVGCDNENEGEYYPSNITAGHNVIVSWFKFDVGTDSYHYRTTYQVQPLNSEDIQESYSKAIKGSLRAISAQIITNH